MAHATEKQIRECAASIAAQAQAIADGTNTSPLYAQARRIAFNTELLTTWVPDDRAGQPYAGSARFGTHVCAEYNGVHKADHAGAESASYTFTPELDTEALRVIGQILASDGSDAQKLARVFRVLVPF